MRIIARHPSFFSSRGETKFFDSLPMLQTKFPDLHHDQELRRCITFIAGMIHSGGTIGYDLSRRGIWTREAYPRADELLENLLPLAKQNRDLGSLFRLVFDGMARNAGCSAWLEKTPTHIYHTNTILAAIPDALFVEIVRDPRDILASKKRRLQDVWHSQRYSPERRPLKHLEKAYDPFWDALAWKSAIRAPSRTHQQCPTQILRIRYEDLVHNAEAEVGRVCDFLEINYEPVMLDVSYRISADLERTGHYQGISSDAVGRWQNALSTPELAVAQHVAGVELTDLGYEPATIPLSAHLAIPLLLLRSQLDLLQRLYRKGRLAGPGYLRNVLINYLKRFRQLGRT